MKEKSSSHLNYRALILVSVSLILIALHFVPWMKYSYVLLGIDENGNEITTYFVEWWSPFYQLFIQSGFHWMFLFLFAVSFIPSVLSLVFGCLSLFNVKYRKVGICVTVISVIVFLILLFVLMLIRPAR